MWCAGAFLASSSLNVFVVILLRTQDPGNDNTWRLSAAVLLLHALGLLQYLVPSGIFAYIQWAISAPLLSWLVAQLLATLPPGSGAPSHQRLFRCALVEGGLGMAGLLLLVFVESPLVRLGIGIVSITALAMELRPFTSPSGLSYLLPILRGSAQPSAPATPSTWAGGAGGNGGISGISGSGARPTFPPRPSQRSQHGGPNLGTGSIGTGGSGSEGPAGGVLPPALDVLLNGMVAAKLLQAISATAVSFVSRGRGLSLRTCTSVHLPSALWSLSTAIALYGLPLAVCMYYGIVRYAAFMLVARRSTLRRVSSLGLIATLDKDEPLVAALGSQSRASPGGGWLGSVRRLSPGPAAGAGGADSDSDSGLPGVPSRLLDVGDLYRITESSGHSISYSISGDEGWRNDLSLTQLLYMAATTFRGAGDRSSLEDVRPINQEGGSSNSGGGSGGSGGGLLAAGTSPRSASPPRGALRTATTVRLGTYDGTGRAQREVGGEAVWADTTAGTWACQTEAAAAAPLGAAAATFSAVAAATAGVPSPPRPAAAESGVQCDLGPSTVVKEVCVQVPVEVRVEVPVAVPAPTPAAPSDGGPLVELLAALREHSSDIAHDMKNPLNGVLALSQNVLQGTFGELPTAAADQLGVVRACAYHLLNMINQLRDCLRMLHGGEPDGNCGRVQLSNAIEEVLKRMSPMVGSRLTVRAENDPSLIVFADDGRLYQSVHTVLANAFKYTRKGGVTIETTTTPDKSAVTLRVSDTGAGFTPEQLEKFNSPLTGSPEEQLGLGLTMVKRAMAYFGGVLRLGNRSGGSSGGWVELTFRTAEDVPPLGAGLPPPPQAPAMQMPQPTASPAPPVAPAAAAAAPAVATIAAAAAAASAVAQPAPAPPPAPATAPQQPRDAAKKLRKSVVGSDRPAVDERLAVANSSTDTGPRSGRGGGGGAGGGGGSAARGGGGIAGADEHLTAKGDELVRVLIVDDDPVNLTILEDLLRAEGYDVLTAASGTEALETYLTSDPQPKLVLLDVTLPDLSGHEVCLKMRSLTPGVPPPIIMISGKASTKDVIKGLQAGACDYITKPFQPQEVMARVETQLRLFMGEVAQLQEAAERNMALLRQILPPHILASLRGGTRVLVEKFSDVVVLCADVVGFSALAAAADTADCILTLNRLFSTFDALTDKMGVHKMDCHTDCYVAALGHMPPDRHMSNVMQVKLMLDLAREMLVAVETLPYPDTLGKMQIRIGVHVGAVYGGVIGVKYPRYSLFGTTLRLAQGLQSTALPNTIHVTEVVHNRVRAAGGETFTPYTTSQVQSLGIIRTYLAGGPADSATGGPPTGMLDFSQLDNSVVVEYLRTATASTHGITVLSCLLGAGGPAVGTAAGIGVGVSMGPAPVAGYGAGVVTHGGATAAAAAATSGGLGVIGPGTRVQHMHPGIARLSGAGASAVAAATAVAEATAGGGGGPAISAGGALAPPPQPPPQPSFKIIPVISGMALSSSGSAGGDGRGGEGSGGGGGRDSGGVGERALPGGIGARGESDDAAAGFAISLAHTIQEATAQELVSTMAGVASGDVGSLHSFDSTHVVSIAAPTAACAAASTGSASTAAGPAVTVGQIVPSYGAVANIGMAGLSGSGSSRRQTSDASLVQDLSPGPPAPGLTRMQRMHAPQTLAPVPGSGAASPRPGGSTAGSQGPSRSTSFRLGLGGPGTASPLAATVMQQQLLTALQQQQLQQQQQQMMQQPTSAIPVVAGQGQGPAGANTLGSVHGHLTPGSTISTTEEVTMLVGDLDGGGGGSSGVASGASAAAAYSTSEPLLKLQGSAASEAAAGAGRPGISSSTMRRIHLPLKAASIGALPGAETACGVMSGSAVYPYMYGGGTGAGGAGTSSFGGSISGGGLSTAGSLGSPPLFFSPGHTRADLSQPNTHISAHGGVSTASAAAAASSTPITNVVAPVPVLTAAAASVAAAATSPYAGLSDETRARLARLRTASQPDLHDALAGLDGGGIAAAKAGVGTGTPPSLSDSPYGSDRASLRQSSQGMLAARPAVTAGGGAASATPQLVPTRTPAPTPSAQPRRAAAQRRPSTVDELLESLGLGHYSRSISGGVVSSLNELATLDDAGLRRVGLVSSRSRKLVQDELRRWDYK